MSLSPIFSQNILTLWTNETNQTFPRTKRVTETATDFNLKLAVYWRWKVPEYSGAKLEIGHVKKKRRKSGLFQFLCWVLSQW